MVNVVVGAVGGMIGGLVYAFATVIWAPDPTVALAYLGDGVLYGLVGGLVIGALSGAGASLGSLLARRLRLPAVPFAAGAGLLVAAACAIWLFTGIASPPNVAFAVVSVLLAGAGYGVVAGVRKREPSRTAEIRAD